MKIAELSFNFSLKIIALCRILNGEREYVISKQLLRAGTSIGANVQEAGAGVSKKDFILKMSIASKEARETRYWLRLIDQSKILKGPLNEYLSDIEVLIKILTKIVKTSQLNLLKT